MLIFITSCKRQLSPNHSDALTFTDSIDYTVIVGEGNDNGSWKMDTSIWRALLCTQSNIGQLNPKTLYEYIRKSKLEYPLEHISICYSNNINLLKQAKKIDSLDRYTLLHIHLDTKQNSYSYKDFYSNCEYDIYGYR